MNNEKINYAIRYYISRLVSSIGPFSRMIYIFRLVKGKILKKAFNFLFFDLAKGLSVCVMALY